MLVFLLPPQELLGKSHTTTTKTPLCFTGIFSGLWNDFIQWTWAQTTEKTHTSPKKDPLQRAGKEAVYICTGGNHWWWCHGSSAFVAKFQCWLYLKEGYVKRQGKNMITYFFGGEGERVHFPWSLIRVFSRFKKVYWYLCMFGCMES